MLRPFASSLLFRLYFHSISVSCFESPRFTCRITKSIISLHPIVENLSSSREKLFSTQLTWTASIAAKKRGGRKCRSCLHCFSRVSNCGVLMFEFIAVWQQKLGLEKLHLQQKLGDLTAPWNQISLSECLDYSSWNSQVLRA